MSYIGIGDGISDTGLTYLRRLRRRALLFVLSISVALVLFWIGAEATGWLAAGEVLGVVMLNLWYLRQAACPLCGLPFFTDGTFDAILPFPFASECTYCSFSSAGDQ